MTKYEFSEDWFSYLIPRWQALCVTLGWRPEEPRKILEIGSFEGRSTIWIIENLMQSPRSELYCCDPFTPDPPEDRSIDFDAVERRFMRNVEITGKADQVRVLKEPSYLALSRLIDGHRSSFDFAYVDGSHRANDVLSDLVLSYHLLKDGGLLICDDYLWTLEPARAHDVLETPKIAIDAFSTIFRRSLVPIDGMPLYQVAFQKTFSGSAMLPVYGEAPRQ